MELCAAAVLVAIPSLVLGVLPVGPQPLALRPPVHQDIVILHLAGTVDGLIQERALRAISTYKVKTSATEMQASSLLIAVQLAIL